MGTEKNELIHKKSQQKIIWFLLALLISLLAFYFLIFASALTQDENHVAIFLALPKLVLSDVVAIDQNNLLAKSSFSFVNYLEKRGYLFVEQMGSAYVFKKDNQTYTATSQKYSKYLFIISTSIKQTP